jgi:hypothetical protein
VLAMQAQIL